MATWVQGAAHGPGYRWFERGWSPDGKGKLSEGYQSLALTVARRVLGSTGF